MPLFLILLILVSHGGVATSTLDIHYFCFGVVLWTFLEVDWKLFLLLKRVIVPLTFLALLNLLKGKSMP